MAGERERRQPESARHCPEDAASDHAHYKNDAGGHEPEAWPRRGSRVSTHRARARRTLARLAGCARACDGACRALGTRLEQSLRLKIL